jgi:hypothetical protein
VKNACNIALGDWLNSPVIHLVERRGETVRIRASDHVMVKGMQVMVLDEQGKVVERGEAINRKAPSSRGATPYRAEPQSGCWEYVPTSEGKVVVQAQGLAGNVVRAEL